MKVSAKRITAIIFFVAFFLFVATWYYRMIFLLLAVTAFWRKSIRQWMTSPPLIPDSGGNTRGGSAAFYAQTI